MKTESEIRDILKKLVAIDEDFYEDEEEMERDWKISNKGKIKALKWVLEDYEEKEDEPDTPELEISNV